MPESSTFSYKLRKSDMNKKVFRGVITCLNIILQKAVVYLGSFTSGLFEELLISHWKNFNIYFYIRIVSRA